MTLPPFINSNKIVFACVDFDVYFDDISAISVNDARLHINDNYSMARPPRAIFIYFDKYITFAMLFHLCGGDKLRPYA